eukprot:442327_1
MTQNYVPLRSSTFYKYIIFQFLWIAPWISGTLVIPLFGAQWFGNCLIQNGFSVQIIKGCEPDYVKYNLYFTFFGSLGGLTSFLFSSFIGRLTDTFGRKIFILIGIIFWMIPRVTIIFYINFALYWGLGLLADTNGGDQILPALKAALSDILSPNDRIIAFGFIHGAMGTGILMGAGVAIGIAQLLDNYTVLIVSAIQYIILLFYVICFISETIDINHNRVPMSKKVWSNPFKPLTLICHNQFIFYMSLITFFCSLVEAGVMSSLFAYIGHTLELHDDGKAAMVFGIYVSIISIVVVPVSVCLLPFLKRQNVHYAHIIVISLCFRICSLVLLAFVSLEFSYIEVKEYILYASAVLHGAGLFGFAVLEGIVSEFVAMDCRGIAFGIVTSYKGIAGIFGPFAFGLMFTELSDTPISSLFIFVGILIAIIAIIFILIPLKRLLNKIEPQTIEIRLKEDIQRFTSISNIECSYMSVNSNTV